MMLGVVRLAASLLVICNASTTMADVPVLLEAAGIPDVVAAQPEGTFLVVHYTSSLPNCGYCDRNNAHFLQASEALGGYATFAEVITDPWQSFGQQVELIRYHADLGVRMVGLPIVIVYQDGEVVWFKNGEHPELTASLRMGLVSTE